MAWATNPENVEELLETRKFVNKTVVDHNHSIASFKPREGSSSIWGGLTLIAGVFQKVERYSNLRDSMVDEPEVKKRVGISRKE